MNVFQITTSGQITIPKRIREKLKTKHYTCERMEGDVLILRPAHFTSQEDVKKYTIKDLREAIIKKSKCPEETNLAGKIDEIVYGL